MQELQNRKSYAESPEFLPALGLYISLSLQLEVNEIPSLLDYKNILYTHIYVYIYTDTKPITLPCSFAQGG